MRLPEPIVTHLTTGRETLGASLVLSNLGRPFQFGTDTACEGPSCAQASTPCPTQLLTVKGGNVGTLHE